MGLEQRNEGKYITILGGKFCQRVQEGTEGAKTRVNKVGKTVHEMFYNSFTGKLIDIKVTESSYGKSWNFDFKDKEDVYTLQLSYSNSFSTAFLKMLPNVDLTKEMKVSPSTKEVDGKNKSSLFINQDGVALKHAYTRALPNGMPDMEQVVVKGVQVWDDTKRIEFLHNMVQTLIMPKLAQAKLDATQEVAPAPAVTPAPATLPDNKANEASFNEGLTPAPAPAPVVDTDF